jgi:hypothetical protein
MMPVLAQVSATFLAIFLTVLAGYLIFLKTTSANIEAEIQGEGAQIVEEIRRTPAYQVRIPFNGDAFFQAYQRQSHNITGIALVYLIAFDVVTEDAPEIFEMAQRGNISGRLSGRLALWLVQRALTALVPSGVPWPGPKSGYAFGRGVTSISGPPSAKAFTDAPKLAPPAQELFFGSPGIPVVKGQNSLSRRAKPL